MKYLDDEIAVVLDLEELKQRVVESFLSCTVCEQHMFDGYRQYTYRLIAEMMLIYYKHKNSAQNI